MSRVLVTGAGGFCGHAIAAALAARGHEVIATVRPSRRSLARPLAQVELAECDLTDRGALERLVARVRPERCVHAAGIGVQGTCDDLDRLLLTNVTATAALVTALAEGGAERVVTLGSSREHGTPDGTPDDLYGISKLAGGLAAGSIARRSELDCLHLRLFSVYGPGEAPRRLVASLLRAVTAHARLELGDGGETRDFVCIDDVVEATLHALFAPAGTVGTFDVGTGIETSVRELAHLASTLAGADPGLVQFDRDGDLPVRHADTRTTAQQLGWHAATSLRDGIAQTLDALRGELRLAA
jgi:nucleoside-diphosphate-sugar epimerase